jgi:hypothetical protein
MEILLWNLEFWRRKNNSSWKEFACNLTKIDFDFILLQEINPFFIYNIQDKGKYKIQKGSIYGFNINNKNIYYHELMESNQYPFWGTAIIAKEKYKMSNNHFYKNNEYVGSKYFGYESLMCYDFELDNGKIVTIMNFYKKADNSKAIYENGKWTPYGKDYDYEETFFSDIAKIVDIIKDKNILIFAGDFNFGWNSLNITKIEKIGFTEMTNHIENTMVDIPSVYSGHNDCIFINKGYEKFTEKDKIYKVPVDKSPQEIYNNFSDHYGVKCIIEL